MFHAAMINVPWASPEALGRLTIPQLLCLKSDRPPGTPEALDEPEAFAEVLAKRRRDRQAADEEWNRP